MTGMLHPASGPRSWWDTPWCLALLVSLSAVPLLYPPLPPLLDLPSHIGRYRIQLEHDSWATFREYYRFQWMPIGNLGVDLLVFPLEPLLGLERGVKWIVVAIPTLTVAGFLWTAREAHGRVPATALFALPLAYNFPFHFGFVNFTLAMALAFLAFALWLRLGRTGRWRLRAVLFVPLSLVLWLTHAYGWAVLLVVAFGAELVRSGGGMRRVDLPSAFRAALTCLPLAPPVLAILLWQSVPSAAGAETRGWFDLIAKASYLPSPLLDRWAWFDIGSLLVIVGLVALAFRSRRFAFSPVLGAGALLLLACYLVMPGRLLGSSYADMRLMPYLLAVSLLAIGPGPLADARWTRTVAVIGLAFVLARTGGTTVSMALYSQAFQRELAAVSHIREGSRVVAFVGTPCRAQWTMRRMDHLPGIAIARRRVFSNDQWILSPGAQLVVPDYPAAGVFASDPSEIVPLTRCPGSRWRTIDASLRTFPREAFDYLWLVSPPPYDAALVAGLRPVWRDGSSVLYHLDLSARAPR